MISYQVRHFHIVVIFFIQSSISAVLKFAKKVVCFYVISFFLEENHSFGLQHSPVVTGNTSGFLFVLNSLWTKVSIGNVDPDVYSGSQTPTMKISHPVGGQWVCSFASPYGSAHHKVKMYILLLESIIKMKTFCESIFQYCSSLLPSHIWGSGAY